MMGAAYLCARKVRHVNLNLLDLIRVPYVLYGVKYIDLVFLDARVRPVNLKFLNRAPFFQNGAKSGFEMCFDIGSPHLGCWGRNTSLYVQGCV